MLFLRRCLFVVLWAFIYLLLITALHTALELSSFGVLLEILIAAPFFWLISQTKKGVFDSKKKLPVAIPPDINDSNSSGAESAESAPIKSKRPFLDRYDTFIVCPGCGSMVPKGTKLCECGRDLSSPFRKVVRRAAPAVLFLLVLAGVGFGGFYFGQQSMGDELDAQYESGYDTGYSDGYKAGLPDAYNRGIEIGRSQGRTEAIVEFKSNIVYTTEFGKRYHLTPDCNNTAYETPVPLDEATAITRGYHLCATCMLERTKTSLE